MSKSQWVNRDFRRVAFLLAAILLLVGAIALLVIGINEASYGSTQHSKLLCAHDMFQTNERRFWDLLSAYDPLSGKGGYLDVSAIKNNRAKVDLKALGCSEITDLAIFAQIKIVPQFSWLDAFLSAMAPWVPVTLFLTLLVYGVVSGSGWILGRFAVTEGQSPANLQSATAVALAWWRKAEGIVGNNLHRVRMRQDPARIRRQLRAQKWDYWLRGVGHVTRPVVYFGPMVLLILWLWPYLAPLGQPLNMLTLLDLLLIGGCVLGFFGVVIPLMLFFFNVDGEEIDWETWGRFGLGLAAVVLLGLWLAHL